MSSIEESLTTILEAHAGVSALVGSRIYAAHLPQKPTYPCIGYRKNDGLPISLLAIDTDIIESRFEVAAFSKTFDESINVGDEIRKALQRYQATIAGMVIMDCIILDIDSNYESDLELYETTLTVKFTHRV